MANNEENETLQGLNEILRELAGAIAQTHTTGTGRIYSQVDVSKLKKWGTAIHEVASSMKEPDPDLENRLLEAQGQIEKLHELTRSREDIIKGLRAEKARIEKKNKDLIDTLNEEIAGVKSDNEKLRAEHDDNLAVKNETIQLIAKLKQQLTTPDGKFDPEVAKTLASELQGYEAEVKELSDLIAADKANLASNNKKIDQLSKERTALNAEVAAAKAEEAKFMKALDFARKNIEPGGSLESLDEKRVTLLYGRGAVVKLKQVLELPVTHVRDRISKLQAFFAATMSLLSTRANAMIGVLKHAYDILKANTSGWAATIAPWVETILKDVLTGQLKSPGFYKDELAKRTMAVSGLKPDAPLAKKVEASVAAAEPRPTWREAVVLRAKSTRARLSLAAHWVARKAKAAAAYCYLAGLACWNGLKSAGGMVVDCGRAVAQFFAFPYSLWRRHRKGKGVASVLAQSPPSSPALSTSSGIRLEDNDIKELDPIPEGSGSGGAQE